MGTGTCTITASQGGSANYAPAPDVPGSFEVYTGRKPQTITFDPVKDTPAHQPVPLHATASSKLQPVRFAASPTDVCTVTESTVTGAKAGTCTITASQAGDDTWAPAQAQQQFTVTKAEQTITFDPVKDTPAHQPVPLHATASSKLQPVRFAASPTDVCTVTESTVTGAKAGTCTITASQAGDDTWAPAQAQQQFTVTKAEQTITFDPVKDTPAHQPVPLHATASSKLQPVRFAASPTDVCTVTESTVTGAKAGTCTITASQAGDDTWAPAQAQQQFTVTKAEQTITFDPVKDTPAHQPVPLHATASSKLQPVRFAASPTDVCTVTESTVTGAKAGTCTITASQAGDDTWAPAQAQQQFTVTKAEQTITFDPVKDTPAHQPVPLHATASSKLQPVRFAASPTDVCTVTESTVTAAPRPAPAPSPPPRPATTPGHQRRRSAFQVNPTGKKSQTIAFAQPSPAAVGAPVTLSASASSGLAVSFISSTTAVCTVSGSTVTTVAPGTCMITASQGGNADYAPARDVTQSFQVNPAGQKPQTITFAPPKDTKVGEPVTLSASASSGLPVSFASSNTAVCTVAGSTATPVAAGTCTITASQSGDASYAPARDVTQSFQVNAAGWKVNPGGHKSQTITFAPPRDTLVGEPVTLSASASSGLPVSFASNTPAVCAVSGSTVTTMAVGACMITASQGGSADYAAAAPETRSFQVDLAVRKVNPAGHKSQTITFDPPSPAKAGDPVTLSASASSGLPVSYTSDTPPVCTVSGSTVRTMAAGPCMITASQGGSADYAAAAPETRSFQVNPTSPTGTGPLVFLLAAAVMAAAGLTAGVRRLRLRSRRPVVHAPNVRAVPEPGPPGQVDVHDTGPTATRTVRIESNPGASITTIEEARP